MTRAQVIVVILTVLMNAMDGFDVLSIAFASPGIAREWGIAQTALGVVLSMELIGMAFGSVLLGGVADKCNCRSGESSQVLASEACSPPSTPSLPSFRASAGAACVSR